MHQTLLIVPQWLLEGPLLIGWLAIWGVALAAIGISQRSWKDVLQFVPVVIVGAVVLGFLLPRIGIEALDPQNPDGPPIRAGLAVRGYGVLVLAGIVFGVGISLWMGKRQGLDPEKLVTLAFWMIACGVVGARAFFVIQKWDQFEGASAGETLGRILNLTQGGLVVYGSLIGAILGGSFYLWYARLPILKVADIASIGMLVGLALGRIGCLMNGCCYGGICPVPEIAMSFPAGSPPYMQQLAQGSLFGITPALPGSDLEEAGAMRDAGWSLAASVEPGSIADSKGIRPGDWFRIREPTSTLGAEPLFRIEHSGVATGKSVWIENRRDTSAHEIPLAEIPKWSRGIYPTQLLAAIDAGLLALVLGLWYPYRRRDGRVFALLLVFHGISRFLMEIIRDDEGGQFGTSLTISQWISLGLIAAGCGMYVLVPRFLPETPAGTPVAARSL